MAGNISTDITYNNLYYNICEFVLISMSIIIIILLITDSQIHI